MAGNPNSVLLKIGNQRLRGLVDSGADTSLLSKKIFDNLKDRPKLIRDRPSIQSVSGEPLKIIGCANITFKMGNLTLTHKFYITEGMNRNIILGREWLKQNGVRIYVDLGYLRVRNTYIRLEEDIHISSLLRLTRKTNFKPQTATVCMVKVNKGFKLSEKGLLEISAADSGYLSSEPGLEVCKSVSKVNNSRKIPFR